VLEGTVRLGMGREWNDDAMETLPTGSFFYMHPGMVHFVATDDDTVIQLNAVGPWEIHYINPSDDPRLAQR
jgi:hypothetical protein